MPVHVLNTHSGERLQPEDPASLASLDALKSWLSSVSEIPTANQILLTPSGKQAKLSSLATEPQLFLYDRSLISPSANSKPSQQFKPQSLLRIDQHPSPPDAPSDGNDLRALQTAFRARRDWALKTFELCKDIGSELQEHLDAADNIERGVAVAVGNLQSHVKSLKQKHKEAVSWSEQSFKEHSDVVQSYQAVKQRLHILPANEAFLRFIPLFGPPPSTAESQTQGQNTTLDKLVPPRRASEAPSIITGAHETFLKRVKKLEAEVTSISSQSDTLVGSLNENHNSRLMSELDQGTGELLDEVEVLAKKINSDCTHLEELGSTSKAISQASKLALTHTRNHLPSLQGCLKDLSTLTQQAADVRSQAAASSSKQLQRVATIESAFAHTNSVLEALEFESEDDESFDFVNIVIQLPFVYGSLLIEAVRRKEWSDRLKTESAILAEDIAGYREEEEKRRKKWLKTLDSLVNEDVALGSALSFELNLHAETREWPEASRDEISEFLQALRTLDNQEETINHLAEAAKDLDRPTKRQLKRAKAFKNGSFHEANKGKGSFLLRENDEVKILRDSNIKLEEDLRGQKSRVRKLEDLLYKQGQIGRTTSGNIFRTSEEHLPSPMSPNVQTPEGSPRQPESLSRKASTASHRNSISRPADEKALARRIVELEVQLNEERQKNQELQKAYDAKTELHGNIREEMEEARSTKKDLMANLDAQQREFADERRLLEGKADDFKTRMEDAEEELDRLIGSRDNEKITNQEKLQQLDGDLTAARQEIKEREDRWQNRIVEIEKNVKAIATERDLLKEDKHRLEHESTQLQEQSDAATARENTLKSELESTQGQIRQLRVKLEQGADGSEMLKQRAEEQNKRASTLASQLSDAKSHVNSLDVQLSTLQRKHDGLQSELHDAQKRLEDRTVREKQLTDRLMSYNEELVRVIEPLGLTMTMRDGLLAIQRVSRSSTGESTALLGSNFPVAAMSAQALQPTDILPEPVTRDWSAAANAEEEARLFSRLVEKLDQFNLGTFSEAIVKLRRDIEWTGKKWKVEARNYREKFHKSQSEAHEKIAFRSFKEGDLALFLPTRNQATRPWAAFNVGAPHYFLREQDSHKLQNREWLVARISRIEERVVDLSKTIDSLKGDNRSIGETSEGGVSYEDENPFELSDGLRWYLLDATEEKVGAPFTLALSKATVASVNVDAKGSIGIKKAPGDKDASSKLNKNLSSRRSSSNSHSNSHSKRGSISSTVGPILQKDPSDVSTTPSLPHDASRKSTDSRPQSASQVSATPNTSFKTAETGASEEQPSTNGQLSSSPSKRFSVGLASGLSPSRQQNMGTSYGASPVKQGSGSPLKPRPEVKRTDSYESAPSESAKQAAKPSAWESLWSVDVNLGQGKQKK